jgi:hypothetical protein
MMLIMALISLYQSITRPLVASDWDRFDFYAKRIKRLDATHYSPGPTLDPSSFRIIELSRRPLPLLPNLRHLDTFASADHPLWNMSPLLGHKLKHFDLVLFGSAKSLLLNISVLASLLVHTPFLEYLQVSNLNGIQQFSSVLSGTICSLQHLRVLKLGYTSLTLECINHLSTLSNLADLEIMIARDTVVQAGSATIRATSFPALRVLIIWTELWVTADAFFEAHLQPSSLEMVTFWVDEAPMNKHFHQLFTTMRKCCSLRSLTDITLSPQEDVPDDDVLPDHVLDPNTLHILFAFANLEVLSITTLISFANVDNALIKDMASAWPSLKTLDIQYFGTSSHTTNVTLHGLLPLASCSSLKQLSINLDATIHNEFPHLRPGRGVSNTSLLYLAVGQSPITDPYAVASFLSDVFAKLAIISTGLEECAPEFGVVDEYWDQAKDLFDKFVDIRMQERLWSETADRTMYVCRPPASVKLCCAY